MYKSPGEHLAPMFAWSIGTAQAYWLLGQGLRLMSISTHQFGTGGHFAIILAGIAIGLFIGFGELQLVAWLIKKYRAFKK